MDKLIAWVGALLAAAAFGALGMGMHLEDEMQAQTDRYATAYSTAAKAKKDAEARAENLEARMTDVIAHAASVYEKDQDDQHTQDARVIADLRGDVVRLRVRTNSPAAGSGQMPGAAPGAAGSDGAATETLAGAVAARLAGRYADYNDIVDQLTLCQAVVAADRLQPAN